ncbi:MAG: hypothetical protein ACRD6B_09290 [Bryobacteraceae bacterium]
MKTDNSYMDLKPGWKLRIVVPLLKSGGFIAKDLSVGANGTLSSKDLIGYTAFHYAVLGRRNGLVRLKFLSAVWNGNAVVEPHSPALPFALPTGTKHIRLVYLVRVSEADHNMAITASKSVEALNAFMQRFEQDPSVCSGSHQVFCSWVPAGIAVRPEKQ